MPFARRPATLAAGLAGAALIATGLGFAAAEHAGARAERAGVQDTIDALYDVISGPAGEARDWDRMRSLFHDDAIMSVVPPEGSRRALPLRLNVEDYIERSGPILERDGFFELEIASEVEIYGTLAHSFSTYAAKRTEDGEVFMRGINSIQLGRDLSDTERPWKVISIAWCQETPRTPIPAEYDAD
ncbi:MAG: hypothetical protein AAFR38_09080 [Planctomycetota bacterium]